MGADRLAGVNIFDPFGGQVIVVVDEGERRPIKRWSGP